MPIYLLDKPLHLTSHDVVAKARKILKTKKIGHTGTLDPLVTGVLVLCVGESTKVVQFLEHDRKEYLAFVALGATTPTLDAEGPISSTAPVPQLDAEHVQTLLNGFLGAGQQMPPAYSAIHIDGKRAYDLARAGIEPALKPRDITIFTLELLMVSDTAQLSQLGFDPQNHYTPHLGGKSFAIPVPLGDFPVLVLRCEVSSGGYIRSLARDIALKLGTVGHLAALVRTRAGRFALSETCVLEDLPTASAMTELQALHYPVLEVSPEQAVLLRQGKKMFHPTDGRVTVVCADELIAVADVQDGVLKVTRVWA